MRSGSEVLGDIDGTIAALREEITRTDKEIKALIDLTEEKTQKIQALFELLAKVRLDTLEQDTILSDAPTLQNLLQERTAALKALEQEILGTKQEIEKIEKERQRAHRALLAASEEVARKEANIQAELENDPAYQNLLLQARQANERLMDAQARYDEAYERREKERIPYENDPFFLYLWKRRYGTPRYSHGGVIKWLDGRVARMVGYENNRRNYFLLQEILEHLKEYLRRQKENYQERLKELAEYERAKAQAEGLNALQEEEQSRRESLDQIDDALAEEEARLDALVAKRQRFFADEDDYGQHIRKTYAQTLERAPRKELLRMAHTTHTPQDDAVVARIEALFASLERIENDLERKRDYYDQKIVRLKELEAIRNRFKYHRYDDYRSEFDDPDRIGAVLGDILGGVLQSGILWDTLQNAQRHRRDVSWPDFGSGGMDFDLSPWSFPQSRGGDISFTIPSDGGFDSRNPFEGGFRTGGGF